MSNITTFSDKELAEEILRRKTQRLLEERQERERRLELVVKHRNTLLEFVPHGRSSCSDADRSNGLGTAGYGARCNRCALLELDVSDASVYDVTVDIRINRVPDNT